jgi:hypothetical protein
VGEEAMITHATRRESYEQVKPKINARQQLILDILGNRNMTADEITSDMLASGYINYYDRNFVSPRLHELEKLGAIEQVGKRHCKRTGRTVTVFAKIGRANVQPTLFARG